MKPETLYQIQVRDVPMALDAMAMLDVVQHNVSDREIRWYLQLNREQWWQLTAFLKEREAHANGSR